MSIQYQGDDDLFVEGWSLEGRVFKRSASRSHLGEPSDQSPMSCPAKGNVQATKRRSSVSEVPEVVMDDLLDKSPLAAGHCQGASCCVAVRAPGEPQETLEADGTSELQGDKPNPVNLEGDSWSSIMLFLASPV